MILRFCHVKYCVFLIVLFCTLCSYGENDSSWRFNQVDIDIQHRISPFIELTEKQFQSFINSNNNLDGFQFISRHFPTDNLRLYVHGSLAKKKHQFHLGLGYGYDYQYEGFASNKSVTTVDSMINFQNQLIFKDSGSSEIYSMSFYNESIKLKLTYRYTYSQSQQLRFFAGAGIEWIQPLYSDNAWTYSKINFTEERNAQDSFFASRLTDSLEVLFSQPINFNPSPQFRFFGLTGLEYYPLHGYGNWGRLGIFAQFEASGIWSSDQLFNPETFLHFQYGLGLSYQF